MKLAIGRAQPTNPRAVQVRIAVMAAEGLCSLGQDYSTKFNRAVIGHEFAGGCNGRLCLEAPRQTSRSKKPGAKT